MPIASTDLILVGSANRPTNDSGTSGGAVDANHRPVFVQLAANDDVEVLSSSGADTTQTATLTARDLGGAIVAEGVTLNGVTPVIFSTIGVVERVLRFILSAPTAGVVTVRRSVAGAEISTVPIGELGFFIMFYDSFSDPDNPLVRYEKVFWKNTHGTLTLTNSKVTLTADPSSKLNIRLEDAVNDNNSSANRLVEPTGNGGSWVGVGVEIGVPGDNLTAGSVIGVWIRQSLNAADSPIKNTFDLRLAGTTT
jgi:hypothetical protein